MQVYENIWEESYGGNHHMTVQVDEFKHDDIVKIYKRTNINDSDIKEIVIDTTGFNKVHQIDWSIKQATENEFNALKNLSIQKIKERIKMLKGRINTHIDILDLNQEVDVTISTNRQSPYFNNMEMRVYSCFGYKEFQDNWRTQVTIRMTLKDLLMKHIIHTNNHHKGNDYGFISYKIEIFNKKVVNFFKNQDWSSTIWQLPVYQAEIHSLQKALIKVKNLNYDDL